MDSDVELLEEHVFRWMQGRRLTHSLLSLLGVFVVLLEQQGPPDADLTPGWAAIGVVPAVHTRWVVRSVAQQGGCLSGESEACMTGVRV